MLQRRCPAPAGRRGSSSSPCCGARGQGLPAGVGVLLTVLRRRRPGPAGRCGSSSHRAAASVPSACRQAWEFLITVLRRRRPGPAGRRGSSSSPCRSVGAQRRPAGVGVLHHRARRLLATAILSTSLASRRVSREALSRLRPLICGDPVGNHRLMGQWAPLANLRGAGDAGTGRGSHPVRRALRTSARRPETPCRLLH